MNEIRILSPSAPRSFQEEIPSDEMSRLFRLGEILRGRLGRQIEAGQAVLHVRGRDLLVETRLPLPPGLDLQFRVEEVQPRVILRFLPAGSPEEEKIFSLLKKLLSGDASWEKLAAGLERLETAGVRGLPPALLGPARKFLDLLRTFGPSRLFSGDPAGLQKMLDESGLFWEAKVRQWASGERKDFPPRLLQEDLKGLGSRVLQEMEALRQEEAGGRPALPGIEELKDTLEPFLRKIELYQNLNAIPAEGQDRFWFFLPFWAGNRLQFLEFNLSLEGKEPAEGEREGCSLLFLLSLPALGKIRIEVQMKEKDLFCRFRFSDARVSDFARRELPALGNRLGELGYRARLEVLAGGAEMMEETLLVGLDARPQTLVNRIV